MNIGVVMYQTSFTKGQELVAQRMARELAREGHKAYLITGPFHDNKIVAEYKELERSVDGYLFFKESVFGVPLFRVDGYLSTWPPRRIMFQDFVSILRKLTENFGLDVIISHSTLWNGPEEIVRFIIWNDMLKDQGMGGKEVIYAHMAHYQPPDPGQYGMIERTYRAVWNAMVFPSIFRNAKLILCTTPMECDQMVAIGAKRGQCLLYPGGVDEDLFKKYWSNNPSDFLRSHSIPADAKLVSYLGTVEERKNPLVIVKAAKLLGNLSDVHFVIAGYPSTQHRQVEREAKQLRNVSYVGPISEEEKVLLIKSSYVNVLMSRMEAFGLTQAEFMYGGVPIITSAIGGQKWLIRNGLDGFHLMGPDDLNGLVATIKTLVNDIELRNRLGKNAKERASEFTLSKLTSELATRLISLKSS